MFKRSYSSTSVSVLSLLLGLAFDLLPFPALPLVVFVLSAAYRLWHSLTMSLTSCAYSAAFSRASSSLSNAISYKFLLLLAVSSSSLAPAPAPFVAKLTFLGGDAIDTLSVSCVANLGLIISFDSTCCLSLPVYSILLYEKSCFKGVLWIAAPGISANKSYTFLWPWVGLKKLLLLCLVWIPYRAL